MPIYEYRCQSCNHEMEALVRSGKEPETCPECQGSLTRKISRAGVIFKGSGFYVNDSRGSSSASKSSNGGGGEATKSDSGGASESKTGDAKASSEKSSPTTKTDTSSKSSD